MDPATAFSVACGAFQLADLCCRGAKAGWEIYQSDDGLTEHMREVEKELDHITEATTSVKQGLDSLKAIGLAKLPPDQKRLQKSCEECLRLSTELYRLLDSMKPGTSRGLTEFAKALRQNATKRAKVKSLRIKIEDCRRRMDTDLLITLGKRIDFTNETQRRALADINETLLRQTKAYRRFGQQFESILGRFDDLTDAVKDESQKTRDQVRNVDRERAEADATRRLLESLSFAEFGAREAQIQPTHSDTFEWIFKADVDTPGPGDDLVQWLEQDGEIYWISGKLGSGKSTLTKFIAGHEQTQCHLVKWAANKRLLLLKFFFFRAGGILVRRLAGLYQSLIIQILQHAPEHSTSVQVMLQAGRHLHGVVNWDPVVLRKCLFHLLAVTSTSHRICFIIDGLDEAEEDADVQKSLVELVKDLSRLPHAKLLLSSRPEPHLLREMESFPKLRLQDLTARDIRKYIDDRLQEHPRLARFFQEGSLAREYLSKLLFEKADGVFLWIALAMKEMNRGLNKFDTPREVLDRLRAIDSSLHCLFETMVHQIDDAHKPRMASLLWSLMSPMSPNDPYNDNGRYDNILMLALGHGYCEFPPVNRKKFLTRPFLVLEDDELDALGDDLEELRLLCQNQCAGLVDVYSQEATTFESRSFPLVLGYNSRRSGNGDLASIDVEFYWNREVRIVHRSLFEYLRSSDAGIKLLENSPWIRNPESGVALSRVQSSSQAALIHAYAAWHKFVVSCRDDSEGSEPTSQEMQDCCIQLERMHDWVEEVFENCEPLIRCHASEDEAVSALLACEQILNQILSNLIQDAPWLLSTNILRLASESSVRGVYQLRRWHYLGQQHLLKIEAAHWGFERMIQLSSSERHLDTVFWQQSMAAAIFGLRSHGFDHGVSKRVRNCGIIKKTLLMGADPNETIATQLIDGWDYDHLDHESEAMSLWQHFVAVLTLSTLFGEYSMMYFFSRQGPLVGNLLRLFIGKGADQGSRITYRRNFNFSTGQRNAFRDRVSIRLQLSSTLSQLLQQAWTILETARWWTAPNRPKKGAIPVHKLKSGQNSSVHCTVESISCIVNKRNSKQLFDFYQFPVHQLNAGAALYIAETLAYRSTVHMNCCTSEAGSRSSGASEEGVDTSLLWECLKNSYPYDIASVLEGAVKASDWEIVDDSPRTIVYKFRTQELPTHHDEAA